MSHAAPVVNIWLPYVVAGTGSDVFTKVLAEALQARGHGVEVTPIAHRWQYFPWRMATMRSKAPADVVVANSWNAFAFRASRAKLVVVEHLFVLDPALAPYKSLAQEAFHRSLVSHFVERSYRAADAVVALSGYARDRMRRRFPAHEPTVIYNGVDTEFFSPARDRAPLDGRRVRLLFVGNPTRRKGADLLPQIMRALGPGFELHYTCRRSDGDPFAGEPNMEAVGRLDRVGTRDAYRKADLFVFPSRLEGLPLAVLEAMACGVPAVVSDAASLPEIVRTDVNGALCKVDDVCGMADAIRRLAADPALLARNSVGARRTAVERFSLPLMVAAYERLFSSIHSEAAGCGSRT